jgi:hypothetical protein
MNLIDQNIELIRQLCKRHNVRHLFAFGSIFTNRFNAKSDIDFIVDFNEMDVYQYADNYFDLKFSLEQLLKREVDLLEEKAIKNPFFQESINSSKVMIYG